MLSGAADASAGLGRGALHAAVGAAAAARSGGGIPVSFRCCLASPLCWLPQLPPRFFPLPFLGPGRGKVAKAGSGQGVEISVIVIGKSSDVD